MDSGGRRLTSTPGDWDWEQGPAYLPRSVVKSGLGWHCCAQAQGQLVDLLRQVSWGLSAGQGTIMFLDIRHTYIVCNLLEYHFFGVQVPWVCAECMMSNTPRHVIMCAMSLPCAKCIISTRFSPVQNLLQNVGTYKTLTQYIKSCNTVLITFRHISKSARNNTFCNHIEM
jgi:hypothetical protein